MVLLISCGKTKYIYKTEIKEVVKVKLAKVDQVLTEPVPVPTWNKPEKPKYVDLKKLYIDTKASLKFSNAKLDQIKKSQQSTPEND